jgi:hypothetical protein
VRLVGIDAPEANVGQLDLFEEFTGLDENGLPTPNSVISGHIHFDTVADGMLDKLNGLYPDLVITFDTLIEAVIFEDPLVEQICLQYFDTDSDGLLSKVEAAAASVNTTQFAGTGIVKFNEFKFFTATTQGNIGLFFSGCPLLQELTLPSSVINITTPASQYTLPALKKLSFEGDSQSQELFLNFNSYGTPVFSPLVEEVFLDRNIRTVSGTAFAFRYMTGLKKITIGNNVTSIDQYFAANSGVEKLVFPATVTQLKDNIVNGATALQYIEIEGSTPPTVMNNTFAGYNGNIYVPDAAVNTYRTAQYWSDIADRILPLSSSPSQS